MNTDKKLALGAMLATVGGLGIVCLMLLNGASLGHPWTFLVGFVFGVPAGAGTVLSVHALIQKRNER